MTKEEFKAKYDNDSDFREYVNKTVNEQNEEVDLGDDSLDKVSGGVQDPDYPEYIGDKGNPTTPNPDPNGRNPFMYTQDNGGDNPM
jgi:hypothetical protein